MTGLGKTGRPLPQIIKLLLQHQGQDWPTAHPGDTSVGQSDALPLSDQPDAETKPENQRGPARPALRQVACELAHQRTREGPAPSCVRSCTILLASWPTAVLVHCAQEQKPLCGIYSC